MPDDVQHNIKPKHAAVAATNDPHPQIPIIDCNFVALLAKQRARNVLHNDRLHPTTMSQPARALHVIPTRALRKLRVHGERHLRQRDRRAITNDLLRGAVMDLEDGLIHHIKKRRKSGNGAAKPASEVLAERRAYVYDQSPGVPKGNMVVPLMDLVVSRRKGKLKCEATVWCILYQ